MHLRAMHPCYFNPCHKSVGRDPVCTLGRLRPRRSLGPARAVSRRLPTLNSCWERCTTTDSANKDRIATMTDTPSPAPNIHSYN